MLGIPRFSSSSGLSKESLGEALLNWGFLRAGLNRARHPRRRSGDSRRC